MSIANLETHKTGQGGKRNAVCHDAEDSTRREGLQGAVAGKPRITGAEAVC